MSEQNPGKLPRLNSVLELRLRHSREGSRFVVITALLHGHYTLATTWSLLGAFTSFDTEKLSGGLSVRLLMGRISSYSKTMAPDDVMRIRICTGWRDANRLVFKEKNQLDHPEELLRQRL